MSTWGRAADRRGLSFWLRAALVCTLVHASARADPAAQARFHDELARSYYKARSFNAALREFFLEQRVSPNPRIAYNIALCFEELDRPDDAFLYFNEYLASDDADPSRRAYAERSVGALKRRVARLSVKSKPEGAEIYVDRRELGSYGRTPKVVAIAPGEHEVRVELDGYRPATAKIAVRLGEEALLELNPARIVGHLRLRSRIVGEVVVRTPSGETVGTGSLPFDTDLAPGNYEVSVQASGYLPWTRLTQVESDKLVEMETALQPAPALTGDLTVTSNFTGALVEVDGEPSGFSPLMLPSVRAGTHELRVHTAALVPWTGKVEVAADERSWLTVSLEDPAAVRRSYATWAVAGIGGAALITAGVLAIMAGQTHRDFEATPAGSDRTSLRDRGVTLNAAADVSLVAGLTATGAAAALYFLTAERQGKPSSASVARSKR